VELVEHSSTWATRARAEARRLSEAMGPAGVIVHHVGSTAIDGIRAKPIVDLLPVATSLEVLDAAAPRLSALGYQWRGEFGIPGRRYCTLDDPATGRREVQLHCFAVGHPEIERMLVFRDFLRAHPAEARAYEAEKERCRLLHPDDTMSYAEAKTAWISACVARARAERRGSSPRSAVCGPPEPDEHGIAQRQEDQGIETVSRVADDGAGEERD
jgi:GrpB-like predicted nucleotidyltransferase (UPF0157 family)